MPKIKVNGIELYYEKHGEGEPLVMIAGLGGTTNGWALQVQEFSKSYQVIIFDNRGCGQSNRPNMQYTIKLLTDDTANLLSTLNIQKANILGISMGGWIAQHLAIHYPHMIKKLILVCTSDRIYRIGEKIIETWKILVRNNQKKALVNELLIWTFSIDYFEKCPRDMKQLEIALSRSDQPILNLNQLDACLGHNASKEIANITAPTLVLAAEQDILYPPILSGPLVKKIPNVKFKVIEGSGHGVIWEQPEAFNKAVVEFLNSP
ncbi:MAG TPA: alpha/beta hydrolase [Nitrospirae bacterium]|nr:alpha/beta hydrolase [Nitrospirota bacterium]